MRTGGWDVLRRECLERLSARDLAVGGELLGASRCPHRAQRPRPRRRVPLEARLHQHDQAHRRGVVVSAECLRQIASRGQWEAGAICPNGRSRSWHPLPISARVTSASSLRTAPRMRRADLVDEQKAVELEADQQPLRVGQGMNSPRTTARSETSRAVPVPPAARGSR